MAALRNTNFLVPGTVSERAGRAAVLIAGTTPRVGAAIGEFVLFLWTAGVVALSLLITAGFIQGAAP